MYKYSNQKDSAMTHNITLTHILISKNLTENETLGHTPVHEIYCVPWRGLCSIFYITKQNTFETITLY